MVLFVGIVVRSFDGDVVVGFFFLVFGEGFVVVGVEFVCWVVRDVE